MLNRNQLDQAVAKAKKKPRVAEVQTSLGLIGVKMLDWQAIEDIEQLKIKAGRKFNDVPHIVVRVACDKDGKRLYSDTETDMVRTMPAADVSKIVRAARDMIEVDDDLLSDEIDDAGKD